MTPHFPAAVLEGPPAVPVPMSLGRDRLQPTSTGYSRCVADSPYETPVS